MSKAGNYIMAAGGVLILVVYILLYTPLYDLLFNVRAARPNLAITRPAATKPLSFTSTREAVNEPVKPPLPVVEPAPKFVVLRDPFQVDFSFVKGEEKPVEGAAPAEAPKPMLVLQGIFLSPGVEAAIIDDQVVNVGTRVALGWKVAEIGTDRVILSQGGKWKVLKIKLGVE
ncbi:hypothetical protein HZC35_03605 [Candidatus Saganbacteria bacterium]|nr:hypothetical protein [Candidatus Saganbacteria bacterium]